MELENIMYNNKEVMSLRRDIGGFRERRKGVERV